MTQVQNALITPPEQLDFSFQLLYNDSYFCSSNIIYIQALSSYSKIFLTNGKHIVIAKTLKKVVEILDTNTFLRIHNSILLNVNFIDKYKNIGTDKVRLQNGTFLSISRRKRTECKKLITKRWLSAS